VTVNSTGVVLSDLLDEAVAFIRRHVGLTAEQADTIAVWVAHSWTISEWRTTPYLHITAPDLGCGKTLLGDDVVGMLVRKALRAATATPSALIRSIGNEDTTLIYDEIDGVFGKGKTEDPAATELRTVFNSGFKRGMPALKCSGPGREVVEFPVFGSKVLIGIGDTLPPATASRCIRVRLERLGPDEVVDDWDDDDAWAIAQPVWDQFEAWSAWICASGRLRVKLPASVFPVMNRDRDKWRPLFTIANEAGGDWPERIHTACLALEGNGVEASYQVRVLRAAFEAFGSHEELSSNDLLVRMVETDETGPWAGWVEERDGQVRATRSGLTRLGNALRQFGDAGHQIRSRNIKIDGHQVKAFRRSDLELHAHRYAKVVHVVHDRMVEPKTGGSRSSTLPPRGRPFDDRFPRNHAALDDVDDLDAGMETVPADLEEWASIGEQMDLMGGDAR